MKVNATKNLVIETNQTALPNLFGWFSAVFDWYVIYQTFGKPQQPNYLDLCVEELTKQPSFAIPFDLNVEFDANWSRHPTLLPNIDSRRWILHINHSFYERKRRMLPGDYTDGVYFARIFPESSHKFRIPSLKNLCGYTENRFNREVLDMAGCTVKNVYEYETVGYRSLISVRHS